MTGFEFHGPIWPPGDEWPASDLPQPALTVDIAAVELEVLIKHHDSYAVEAATNHNHEVELFHLARASYLRQRLAQVVPHRLTPERKGHA